MTIPVEIVKGKIYLIRGQKVLLDSDLAELFDVETKHLNAQIHRNLARFSSIVFPFSPSIVNHSWNWCRCREMR